MGALEEGGGCEVAVIIPYLYWEGRNHPPSVDLLFLLFYVFVAHQSNASVSGRAAFDRRTTSVPQRKVHDAQLSLGETTASPSSERSNMIRHHQCLLVLCCGLVFFQGLMVRGNHLSRAHHADPNLSDNIDVVSGNILGEVAGSCASGFCGQGVVGIDLWISLQQVGMTRHDGKLGGEFVPYE